MVDEYKLARKMDGGEREKEGEEKRAKEGRGSSTLIHSSFFLFLPSPPVLSRSTLESNV